ncbi:MAG TPA: 6-carboxytetrahydropterin synthase [Phycisphaerae bacterium]|nr:6-carboxytetrahydropterin synthase [Phycisphaerae bacterium]HNU46820.1 6-carboxytetrahydropterin synthase [Phycisphaerae bacterium]
MYTVVVESRFTASHRVRRPDGTEETPHAHDWGVRAYFRGPTVDAADMVVDFEHAHGLLENIIRGLHHADLNEAGILKGCNPTAEAVARRIFERLVAGGLAHTWAVAVTEAPGCVAIYERDGQREPPSSLAFDDMRG